MRKRFLFTACVLLAGVAGSAHRAAPGPSPPDVFLITIDTLRSDHVHCYGYEKIQTPAMDGLAIRGIRFTEAFTPSPITNSSHASILTGLLPSSHGVTDFGLALDASHVTLAELLQRQGYQTAAFIGSVILDSKTLAPGLDHGFAFYDNFPERAEGKSRWGRLERRGRDVAQRAEKWLNAHRGGPRFVWVHLYDPHDPYEPPAPYSEIYKDRLYDGEIAYADAALGQFVDYLKQQGWYEGSVMVVVGDHGEGLGEHHEDTHGIFLYDSTTHVPLIVKEPGNQGAGRVVDAQVRTIDIMPTILEMVGTKAPANVDGISLVTLVTGSDTASRTALGETDYPLRFGWAPLRSVRKNGLKFIEAPQPELYDLRADPGEVHNRYAPWEQEVQNARKILADAKGKPPSQGKPSAATVPASTVAELQALGYLGAADARSATDVPEPSLLPDPKDKIQEQNLLHAAMMATEDGQVPKAKASLEQLLQIDADSVIALSQIGELEITSGSYEKAAEYFRRAHKLRPEDAKISLDYGRALNLTKDFAGARDVLQESLKANPKQPEAEILLAKVHFRLKERAAGTDHLAAALLADPGNANTAKEAGKTLIQEREFAQAAEWLEPLAESSSDRELLTLLARAYRGLGRTEDARRVELQAQTPQKSRRN